MNDDLEALAADACIYGFPLVFDLQMVGGQAELGMIAPAPFNSFSHASRLAGPDDRFVSINNDTIYSIAQIDVSGGPVLLRVPDTAGRYYVLQFVDAWTNNFAYVGRRATGTQTGSFLLTRQDGRGIRPARHRSSSSRQRWPRLWAGGPATARLTWMLSGGCRKSWPSNRLAP
jgi:hypothetical protein